MSDAKSRIWVERLLRGDFRPSDLTGLFLYARDHCDGRESVSEIGHFVAHYHEPDRGIITRSTRDWVTTARFYSSRFRPEGMVPVDWSALPPSTSDYFNRALLRVAPGLIKKGTGLPRSAAHQVLEGVRGRLTKNADGTWALPPDLTKLEASVVECACSHMVVKSAFSPDRLVDEFIASLKSNGLITKEEIRDNRVDIDKVVQLFAVSAMHNALIIMEDGSNVQLKGLAGGVGGSKLEVAVRVETNTPNIFIASAVFTSTLDPNEVCAPDLLTGEGWDFEVEVSADRRLVPMR